MFGKYFKSTFTGSMYGAGPVVFAVWGYIIANKDGEGLLEVNPALLGGIIGCAPDDISTALVFLSSPDPESRSEKEEGRRIIKEGRFMYRVVNHNEYVSIENREKLKDYNRKKKRESRARKRGEDGLDVKGESRGCPQMSRHKDIEVDKDKDGRRKKRFSPPTIEEVRLCVCERGYTFDPETFHAYYQAQGWKLSNGNAMKSWESACVTWQKREPSQPKPADDDEWMYDLYRTADHKAHRLDDEWEKYIDRCMEFEYRTAPTYDEWKKGIT